MGAFFNQNSFLLAAAGLEILAAWYFLRSGVTTANLVRLLVVTAVIAAGFFGLRPAGGTADQADDILAAVGQGTPVLLEFKSPN